MYGNVLSKGSELMNLMFLSCISLRTLYSGRLLELCSGVFHAEHNVALYFRHSYRVKSYDRVFIAV